MTLFNADGHLTDEGLQALPNGTLTEMQRLEASEHLSFCDECLLHYLDKLEDSALLVPEEPLAEGILKRSRKKGKTISFSKYATIAAAACLALAVWGAQVSPIGSAGANTPAPPVSVTEQAAERPEGIRDRLNGVFNGLFDSMSDFFRPQRAERAPMQDQENDKDTAASVPEAASDA